MIIFSGVAGGFFPRGVLRAFAGVLWAQCFPFKHPKFIRCEQIIQSLYDIDIYIYMFCRALRKHTKCSQKIKLQMIVCCLRVHIHIYEYIYTCRRMAFDRSFS